MKVAVKFNLVLIAVLIVSYLLVAYLSHNILQKNARQEIVDRAGIMMEAALAMRGYTVQEIKPLLSLQIKREFLPQTVPAYAATQTFEALRQKHAEYSYKEATLNPTNPRDRAVEWESDVVGEFRNNAELNQLIGQRDTPGGKSLYLARPIRITDKACLGCHSTVEAAPHSMIAKYGPANGFGWKLNEVVGAQIISVPMSVPIEHANIAFARFMVMLAVVFVVIVIVLNLMLRMIVLKPLNQMAAIADDLSQGETGAPEFSERGNDEITVLAKSFNRMRRSLEKAIKMLEE